LCCAAVFSHGGLLCWGANTYGQLGQNHVNDVGIDTSSLASATLIVFSDTIPAVQITAYEHTCALFLNGRVRCWGLNAAYQLGIAANTNVGSDASTAAMTAGLFVSFSNSINDFTIIAVKAGR
jgi:alpha-tubulin suppressor-like RCC1 family protein